MRLVYNKAAEGRQYDGVFVTRSLKTRRQIRKEKVVVYNDDGRVIRLPAQCENETAFAPRAVSAKTQIRFRTDAPPDNILRHEGKFSFRACLCCPRPFAYQ